jgi:hypothetical protein
LNLIGGSTLEAYLCWTSTYAGTLFDTSAKMVLVDLLKEAIKQSIFDCHETINQQTQ